MPPTFDNGLQGLARLWDDKRIYFFGFGDFEVIPTIEEIKDCLDSIGTCDKRITYPYHHILLLDRPTSLKLKNMLLLVDTDWLDTQSVPLMRFFEWWGHDNYLREFRNEFHNHSAWRQTHIIAFSACLLGMMVFPLDEGKEIDTRIVMVLDSIFRGIGKEEEAKK